MLEDRATSPLRALVELRRGSPTPVHAQLERGLRAAIRDGRLPPGTRLPATRALAADLAVSRGVVVEAYEQLVAEGYLQARSGSATRVATTAVVGARGPGCDTSPPAPRIDFDFRPGTPDLSLFPRAAWLRAVQRVIRQRPDADLDYQAPSGNLDARRSIAAWLTRTRAAMCSPEDVVLTSGFSQGAALIFQVLCRRGITEVAVEDPGHATQHAALRHYGMTLVPVPVDGDGLVIDALAASGARAVLTTPAHQFPTGVVLAPQRRAALLDWARSVGGVVVEDDYDAEYRYDRAPVGCLQGLGPDVVVYLGTASKVLAPALRLGWLLAPASLAAELSTEKWAADYGSPGLDQLALAELIDSGALDRHLRHARPIYRARRDRLAAAVARHLPRAVVCGIAAGAHAVVEFAAPLEERAVEERAAVDGVAVHGMYRYRISGTGRSALVLGYSRLAESRIDEGIARLATAVSLG